MSLFTFSTTEHTLGAQERATMKQTLFAYADTHPHALPSPFLATVSHVLRESVLALLVVVCVVGVGSRLAPRFLLVTPEQKVASATQTILKNLAQKSVHSVPLETVARMQVGSNVSVTQDALAAIDSVLVSSSSTHDVPLAQIMTSFAQMQGIIENDREHGVFTQADSTVERFLEDRKPLVSLLAATANGEELSLVHKQATKLMFAAIPEQRMERQVFIESIVATQHVGDTMLFIDELSAVYALAHEEAIQL